MNESEDLVEEIKEALRKRRIEFSIRKPPKVGGVWQKYLDRSYLLFNKAMLRIKELKDALFKDPEVDIGSDRFLLVLVEKDVPSFIGIDNIRYGPYRRNDVVLLPKETAEILAKNGYVRIIC